MFIIPEPKCPCCQCLPLLFLFCFALLFLLSTCCFGTFFLPSLTICLSYCNCQKWQQTEWHPRTVCSSVPDWETSKSRCFQVESASQRLLQMYIGKRTFESDTSRMRLHLLFLLLRLSTSRLLGLIRRTRKSLGAVALKNKWDGVLMSNCLGHTLGQCGYKHLLLIVLQLVRKDWATFECPLRFSDSGFFDPTRVCDAVTFFHLSFSFLSTLLKMTGDGQWLVSNWSVVGQ